MKIVGVLWINLNLIPLTVYAMLRCDVIHFTDAEVLMQKQCYEAFVPNVLSFAAALVPLSRSQAFWCGWNQGTRLAFPH